MADNDLFRRRDRALDEFIGMQAQLGGFDVSAGLESSGFVPTLRNLLAKSDYSEYSNHPHAMGTQVAWVSYLFIAQKNGLEMPADFVPKSIIVEAIDGPYLSDSVRISLWAEPATFRLVSAGGVPLDQIKDPEGVPATYAQARRVLENLFDIIVEKANELIPYARAVAAEAAQQDAYVAGS